VSHDGEVYIGKL